MLLTYIPDIIFLLNILKPKVNKYQFKLNSIVNAYQKAEVYVRVTTKEVQAVYSTKCFVNAIGLLPQYQCKKKKKDQVPTGIATMLIHRDDRSC